MRTAFQQLLDAYAIAALDGQLHLADVVGGRPWRVDLAAGTLTFGDDLHFAAQLLGTQSDETGTFIWAWDHPSRPRHTDLAEAVRAAGERRGVAELTTRKLDVTDVVHAHTLAMVAVGLTGADAYYRGPYDGGAAVLLIRDPTFPRPDRPYPLLHAAAVIPQAISAVDLDARRAVPAYLIAVGATVERTPDGVTARDVAGHTLTATFDDLGRLDQLTGSTAP